MHALNRAEAIKKSGVSSTVFLMFHAQKESMHYLGNMLTVLLLRRLVFDRHCVGSLNCFYLETLCSIDRCVVGLTVMLNVRAGMYGILLYNKHHTARVSDVLGSTRMHTVRGEVLLKQYTKWNSPWTTAVLHDIRSVRANVKTCHVVKLRV